MLEHTQKVADAMLDLRNAAAAVVDNYDRQSLVLNSDLAALQDATEAYWSALGAQMESEASVGASFSPSPGWELFAFPDEQGKQE